MFDYERMPNGTLELFEPVSGDTFLTVHRTLAPMVAYGIKAHSRMRYRWKAFLSRFAAKPEYAIPSCRMVNYGWRAVATVHARGKVIRTLRGDNLYSSRCEAIDAARAMCSALRIPHVS